MSSLKEEIIKYQEKQAKDNNGLKASDYQKRFFEATNDFERMIIVEEASKYLNDKELIVFCGSARQYISRIVNRNLPYNSGFSKESSSLPDIK